MSQSAHLYFHSPCFDGIVSAVLAWDFLETSQRWTSVKLHTVNYDQRTAWLSTRLPKHCAVVDFLYHPDVEFWADHHLTSFLTADLRKHFSERKKDLLLYDKKSDSCASLLWNRLCTSFGDRRIRYREMTKWADKIDAARYESVEEAILGDAPALRIRTSLAVKNGTEFSESLVRELRHNTMDQVAQLPEVTKRHSFARSSIKNGLERFEKASNIEDRGIVVFDVDSSGVIISRYSPFYFFREARYSAGIMRSELGATITAMRNPWRQFPSIPLGSVFERFGGGGHQRVGSVFLVGERAKDASQVLSQVLCEIRRQEIAQVGGAGP